jgi:hypothetical protein
MRGGNRVVLGLALACLAWVVSAQDATYYKWTDAAGTVHVSATPPPGRNAKTIRLGGAASGQEGVAPPAVSAPTPELEQARTAYRRRSCEAARNDLRVLAQGRMVVSGDSPDAATKLSVEQRAQARLRAEQRVSQFCETGGKP